MTQLRSQATILLCSPCVVPYLTRGFCSALLVLHLIALVGSVHPDSKQLGSALPRWAGGHAVRTHVISPHLSVTLLLEKSGVSVDENATTNEYTTDYTIAKCEVTEHPSGLCMETQDGPPSWAGRRSWGWAQLLDRRGGPPTPRLADWGAELREALGPTATKQAKEFVKDASEEEYFRWVLSQRARNNSIILLMSNSGYAHFLDNAVCRLQQLDMNFFVVAAVDVELLHHCQQQGYPAFLISTWGHMATSSNNIQQISHDASKEKQSEDFGGRGFRRVTKGKSLAVLAVLKAGYNTLLLDVDIHVIVNPLPFFWSLPHDITIQSNAPPVDNITNGINRLNSGLYWVWARESSVYAFHGIVAHASTTDKSEQPSFQKILCGDGQYRYGNSHCYNPVMDTTTEMMDRAEFPNGAVLLDQNWQRHNISSRVQMLHFNWMSGKKTKMDYFQKLGVWQLDRFKRCRGLDPSQRGEQHILRDLAQWQASSLRSAQSREETMGFNRHVSTLRMLCKTNLSEPSCANVPTPVAIALKVLWGNNSVEELADAHSFNRTLALDKEEDPKPALDEAHFTESIETTSLSKDGVKTRRIIRRKYVVRKKKIVIVRKDRSKHGLDSSTSTHVTTVTP